MLGQPGQHVYDQEDSMEAVMNPPAEAPPADAEAETPAPPAAPKVDSSYLVFEAPGETLKAGDTLTFVAHVSAPDKQQARWSAVDKDKGDLAERTSEEKGGKGVFLLAVAERNARPEMTFEEIVKTTIRK